MSYAIIDQQILLNVADDIADYQYSNAGGMLKSHQQLNNDKNYTVLCDDNTMSIQEREVLKILLEKAKRILNSTNIQVNEDLTLRGESIQPVIAGIFTEFWTN